MPHVETGLQFLARMVFPAGFQGVIGRWLLTKLFDVLRKRKMLPKTIDRWLYRPITEALETPTVTGSATRPDLLRIQKWLASDDPDLDDDLRYVGGLVLGLWMPPLPTDADLDELTAHDGQGVLVAATTRRPGVGEYPKGINPSTHAVWDEMIGDFAEEIERLGANDPLREWAAALIIFQRLCKANGVKGFIGRQPEIADTPEELRAALVPRLERAFKAGLSTLLDVGKTLKEHGVTYGSRDLLLGDPVWRADGSFVMRYFYRFNISNVPVSQRKDLRAALRKMHGFRKGSAEHTLILVPHQQMRHMVRLERENKDEWRLYLEFALSEAEAIALTGQRNKTDILQSLTRITRTWKSLGHIPKEG